MTDILLDTPTSAAPLTHEDALPPGARLAEFEVQGLLGVGGFGLVYRAYDHSLHRTVAIKEYMPAALASRSAGDAVSVRSSADRATYGAGLQSFVSEARLLAQFDHPSLVKVYRFWEANNTAYMVMPLYRGMTLKQARSLMSAPPPEDWLRTVLWSVLQALQVLHDHQTMHRDVSPDNIFLQDVGPPVLLDLGAARRAITDKSQKLTAILKVNFAPIEQYAETDGLTQGPWTDLYSLAAVVYGCLRNDPPLPATTRAVADTMPSAQSVAATVAQHFGLHYSESFTRTIAHALAVQPQARPQSVLEFVREMALQPPAALSKFDWRAELGVTLQSPPDDGGSDSVWMTQPVSALDRTPPSRTVARWADWLPRRALLLAFLAVLLLVAALYGEEWWSDGPLVAVPDPAPMPVLTVTAASDVPALPASTSDPGSPVAAQDMTGGRKLAPASSASPSESVSSPVKPSAPKKPAVRQPVPDRLLCADSSFFTRPICIYRECLKPENAKRPICIEERRRNQDRPPQPPA